MAKRRSFWDIPINFPDPVKEQERMRAMFHRKCNNKIEVIVLADDLKVLNERALEKDVKDKIKGLKKIKLKRAQKFGTIIGYIILSIGLVKATFIFTYF